MSEVTLVSHGAAHRSAAPTRRNAAAPTLALRALTAILIASMGAGGALATDASLPDDPLHELKTATEQLRLDLARSPQQKVAVLLDIAQARLHEAAVLETLDRRADAGVAVSAYGEHVARAAAQLENVPGGLQPRATEQFRADVAKQQASVTSGLNTAAAANDSMALVAEMASTVARAGSAKPYQIAAAAASVAEQAAVRVEQKAATAVVSVAAPTVAVMAATTVPTTPRQSLVAALASTPAATTIPAATTTPVAAASTPGAVQTPTTLEALQTPVVSAGGTSTSVAVVATPQNERTAVPTLAAPVTPSQITPPTTAATAAPRPTSAALAVDRQNEKKIETAAKAAREAADRAKDAAERAKNADESSSREDQRAGD